MRVAGVVGAIAVILAFGVYVAAVLDRLICRIIAGAPLAVLQTLASPLRGAVLLLVQHPTRTERPDAQLWAFAPALLGGVAAAALVAIPLGPELALPAIDAGIVYFGALMAMVMVAVYLHGWSANSVLPLIGGYRFIALALSYEMPLALVLIATALPAASLSIPDIVHSQQGLWNIVRQPLGLPLYVVAGLGLTFWGPLGVADGEDLASGTAAESAGVQLLLWQAARLAVLLAVATMGAAAFLGGWTGPWLPGPVWMVLKTFLLLACMLSTRHLLARVRLERFVVVAWAVLIPLALVDVFAAGFVALRSARP